MNACFRSNYSWFFYNSEWLNFGGLCYQKKLILLSADRFQGSMIASMLSEVNHVVSVPLKSWNLCQKAENSEVFAANWSNSQIQLFSKYQNFWKNACHDYCWLYSKIWVGWKNFKVMSCAKTVVFYSHCISLDVRQVF